LHGKDSALAIAIAQGHFVHVYVDRATHAPVKALPLAVRTVLDSTVR
jgi:hypothetical protein